MPVVSPSPHPPVGGVLAWLIAPLGRFSGLVARALRAVTPFCGAIPPGVLLEPLRVHHSGRFVSSALPGTGRCPVNPLPVSPGCHGSFVCVRYASRYPARWSASKRHAAMIFIWSSASNRLMRGLDTPQAGQLDDGWPARSGWPDSSSAGPSLPGRSGFLSVLCRVGRLGFRWRCCC